MIGAVGGLFAIGGAELLKRLKIDDPVGECENDSWRLKIDYPAGECQNYSWRNSK